ncbi:MAG: hypothetical protein GX074_02860 [Erysipelothrix sp.]|nr:hypothetical protein [Erysipelothrix sp.]
MKKFRKLSLVTLLVMMLLLTACSGGTGGDAGNTGSKFKNVMFVVTGSLGGVTNNDDVYEAVKTYTDKVGGNLNTLKQTWILLYLNRH